MIPGSARKAAAMSHLSRRDKDANIQQIYGVAIFCIVLATLPVLLRFIFRKTAKLRWMADDYLIVLATVRPTC